MATPRYFDSPLSERTRSGIDDPVVARALALSSEAKQGERMRRGPTQPPIRLIIVDTQPLVLMGLATLFGTARHCQVIASAVTAARAVEIARTNQVEVVLLDADMPPHPIVDTAKRIRAAQPSVRVILLGWGADPRLVVAAIHAGVSGYVHKGAEPGCLVDAVGIVAGGGVFYDDAVTAAVTRWLEAGRPPIEPLRRLSGQQRKILRLIAEGRTNREIAAALRLSEYTVKTYVSATLRRLQLASRAEAASFLIKHQAEMPQE